LTDWTVNSVFR